MGIFQRALNTLGLSRTGGSTTQKAGEFTTGSDAFAQSMSGGGNYQSFSSFNNQKQQLQAYTDWVYVAARVIAEHCAAIDLRIFVNNTKVNNNAMGSKLISNPTEAKKYQRKRVNSFEMAEGKIVYRKDVPALEELETHPLLQLLDAPNEFMTKNEFFEITFLHLELTGEAFWAVGRDSKGKPNELWPLMPNQMKVVPDKTHFIVGYIYTVNGQQVPFSPDDIIHHKYGNPMDLRRGFSPVMAAARTVDTDAHAADFNRKFFYNSAAPDGILSTADSLDDKTFKRIKTEWNDTFGGTGNAHRTAILEAGLDYKAVQLNQRDMEFLKGRLFNRDQILAVFGVPKSVVGLDESMSRANAETVEYVFTKRNRTKMQRLVNRITADLAPQFDPKLVVSFTDPVPEDKLFLLQETKAATAGLAWQTVNEERTKRGDDPVDGGDNIYMQGSLVPLGTAEPDPKVEDVSAVAEEDPKKPDLDDSTSETDNSGSESGSSGSSSTNDSGSQASVKPAKIKRLPVPEGNVRCECCDGYGEHNSGFECYKCDASGSLTAYDLKNPVACDGNGNESKSANVLPDFPASIFEALADEKKKSEPAELADRVDQPDLHPELQKFLTTRANLTMGFEKSTLRAASERFHEQRLEVLANLNSRFSNEGIKGLTKKEAKGQLTDLFDKARSKAIWLALLIPIYRKLGEDAGTMALLLASYPTLYGYTGPDPSKPFVFNNETTAIKTYYNHRSGVVSKGIDAETDKQLRATLMEGLSNGEGLQKLSDRVENVYGAASGYRAQRIARTESQSVLHFASGQAWQQSGVVDEYIWLVGSNPDPTMCQGLAGKIGKSPDDFEYGEPPVHPNCTCDVVPHDIIISDLLAE